MPDQPAPRTAAFFDLDKTIIATTSSIAFTRPFFKGGLITRADAIRTAYAQFLFLVGGADERQTTRLRDALSELVKGWEVARVNEIVAETVQELIDPVVYEEAVELIHRHQENGRDVVIVSASGSELVKPIADMLGANHVIASQMEIKKGFYTGTINFYSYGPRKAEAIAALAEERGYVLEDCYAYSDSITDAPMLNVVGHGFAVNPDRTMRRAAVEYGWGVLRFKKPVALRKGTMPIPMLVSLGLIAGTFLTALLVVKATRNRSEPT
jgi:HAD superfamily hydrolase (TIGR01490 family)